MSLTSDIGVAEILAANARTSTATSSGVDSWAQGRSQALVLLLSIGARSGTTPTLDVKLQHSDDDSSYSDVAGAAFAQKTNTGFAELTARNFKRYVRVVATIAGTTPSFTFAVIGIFGDSMSVPI